MSLTPPTTSATARAAATRARQRTAVVRAQHLAGSGTVADVAAFCRVSERQVLNWKEEGVIGFSQIGNCVWFSKHQVTEFVRQYYHAGKFSARSPSEIPKTIEQEWLESLRTATVQNEKSAVIDSPLQREIDKVKDRLESLEARYARVFQQKEAA